MTIRNLGYGAALNVSFENWRLYLTDSNELIETKFNIGIPNVLKIDEQRQLNLESKSGGRDISTDFMVYALSSEHMEKIPLVIRFQDLSGHWYQQKIYAGKGMLQIKGPPLLRNRIMERITYIVSSVAFSVKILYWKKCKQFLNLRKQLK